MSPITELIGSAKAYGWGSFVAAEPAFESIATVSVGSGGSANVEFTSIPATYTHLQIRMFARHSTSTDLLIQMNGDTASNYNYHYLVGTGSSVVSGAQINQSFIGWKTLPTDANIFAGGVLDILDYTNTNKFKTTRALSGDDLNGGGAVVLHSGAWRSTSAITSIKLYVVSGTITQYSSFALYGIKGA